MGTGAVGRFAAKAHIKQEAPGRLGGNPASAVLPAVHVGALSLVVFECCTSPSKL